MMSSADSDDTLRKIFVGGLDYDTNEETVREYFESWGPLSECAIKRFPDGRSRGFAFVTFVSLAALDQCLASSHQIDGKRVDLRKAADGKEENEEVLRAKAYDPEAPDLKKLRVSNLDPMTSEPEITEYFSKFGDLESLVLTRDPESGLSLGTASLEFVSARTVDVIQERRPHSLGDRKLETRRMTPPHLVGKAEADVATCKAFIGPPEVRGKGHSGLSEDITDQALTEYFNQFGIVLGVQQMIWEDSGKKRGYGYVEFDNEDAVDKIVLVKTHILNGRELEAKKCLTKQQMKEMVDSGRGRGREARGTKRLREAVDPEDKIMRKLFVGNLDLKSTEEDLRLYFENFGTIEDVIVHKFADSGKSRGFGFVTFASSSGVDNVQQHRPHEIGGKRLETKRNLPKTDYGTEGARVTKIYIGAPEDEKSSGQYGLCDTTTDEVLREYFEQFGKVEKVDQLKWRDSGKKRGYGYIEFEDEDAVDKAVLIGIHNVLGVKLEACKAIDKNSDDGGRSAKRSRKDGVDPEAVLMRKLFVRNLNCNTVTEEKIREYFSEFGDIETVQLPCHSDSGKVKGFAFVTFKESSSVDSVQRSRPHRLDGWQLETTRATPKEELGNPEFEARSRKVFIGGADGERRGGHSGLTDDISDDDLQEYFSQFGNVTKVDQKVWEDSGKKRGYGYVEFDDEDAVDKIVLMGVHVIKGVRLCAKKGLNKEQIRGGGGRERDRDRDYRGQRGGFDRGRPSANSGGWGDRDRGRDRGRGDRRYGGGRDRDMMRSMGGGKPGDKSMVMMSSMQQMMMNMMNMCNQMMPHGEAGASRGWDQGAGPSTAYGQGYSSGRGARGYAAGSGGAEVPSNSAYPPANSYSGAGDGAAPYSRRGEAGYGTNYGAGTSSGAGYGGYSGGPGQGGYSDYSDYSAFGQAWSSGHSDHQAQDPAARGGPGGGALRGHQRDNRGGQYGGH